ncbi:MAG: hypothetical protein LBD07_05500 [Spirochaetaceae bacterium]|jgi:hypothetical protein|nr:hypothetical protein [Spirochaetaceae bacterium]
MKKRFYALLVAAVFAVVLFGCDNPADSKEQNDSGSGVSSKPTELLLFSGPTYNSYTAALKVKRESDGSFQFYLTCTSPKDWNSILLLANGSEVFYNSIGRYGAFNDYKYAISDAQVAKILNATVFTHFELVFDRGGNQGDAKIDITSKASEFKAFLQ